MENYYKIGRKLMNVLSEVKNTTNSSDVKYLDKVRVDVNALLPAYLIILVACVIGNSLVCLTVIKNPDMKRKRWYYFLMNLSVADMGFALATPVHVLQFSRVDMGDIGCKLGVHIIDTFMITSIMTLAYISIDRYICICFPKIVLQLWGRKGESNSIDNDRSGKKKRSIKMMILATSLFFFSWFPYTMLYLLKEMKVGNPRVVGTDFRKGFKKILFWKKTSGEARIQEARRQQSDMEQNCSSKSDNSAKKTESEGL
eukprot:gene12278-2920_t